jgi:hypothetical protein
MVKPNQVNVWLRPSASRTVARTPNASSLGIAIGLKTDQKTSAELAIKRPIPATGMRKLQHPEDQGQQSADNDRTAQPIATAQGKPRDLKHQQDREDHGQKRSERARWG